MFTDTRDAVRRSIRVLSEDKARFYFAVFLCVLGGVVELVGVGTLYPFLALLAKPELVETNDALRFLYGHGHFDSVNRFLLWTGWLALLTMFLASLFLYLKLAYITWFCVGQTARVSTKVLGAYLRKPLLFHIESNSGELSKDVLGQSDNFTNAVLIAVMTIFGDGIILVVLIGLVVAVDPWLGSMIAAVLGLVLGTAMVLTRKKVLELGQRNDEANGARFAFCVSALQSIKEIKTAGKEEFFQRLFRRHAEEFARCYAGANILQVLPSSVMQFVAAATIVGIAMYYVAAGVEPSTIVPMLALYAVAGYRMMPSFNRLAGALSQLRQFRPAIVNISRVLDEQIAPREKVGNGAESAPVISPTIEFNKIRFAYPKAERTLFNDLDLTIPGNSFLCLVGTSGSGKTTLVDLLLGLLSPGKGEILINGESILDNGERRWRELFGYVPQSIYILDGTIVENIAFGVPENEVDMERIRQIVGLCHLDDLVQSQSLGLNASVGERGSKLSGGQRQRLGIARAIYRNPAVLVLDESTSSLDGISERSIIETLRELKRSKTIIAIAHRSSLVRNCDRVVLVDDGHIAADGSYDDLRRSSILFKALMAEMEGQHP